MYALKTYFLFSRLGTLVLFSKNNGFFISGHVSLRPSIILLVLSSILYSTTQS